jgi:hypothetical protein
MSFDIFVQCFQNGKTSAFKRSVFDEIFGPHVIRRNPVLKIAYADGGGAEIYIDDAAEIESIMFNHCGGDAFFEDLYELLKRARGVVYWSDLPPNCAIPDEEVMAELPDDFVKAVKGPSIVHNGKGIVEAIGRSGES